MDLEDKAITDEEKEEVISAIMDGWKKAPDLRLGQYLANISYPFDIFYIGDKKLMEKVRGKEWN